MALFWISASAGPISPIRIHIKRGRFHSRTFQNRVTEIGYTSCLIVITKTLSVSYIIPPLNSSPPSRACKKPSFAMYPRSSTSFPMSCYYSFHPILSLCYLYPQLHLTSLVLAASNRSPYLPLRPGDTINVSAPLNRIVCFC